MSNGDHLRVIDGEGGRAVSAPPPDPRLGRVIDGRYHVEEVLGEGGMGIVYKARHTILNKPLAIKVLRPEVGNDDEIITRFRQEAQSASGIGNQHIIDISDFGTLPDGATYFVMEFLNGVDLSAAMAEENPMQSGRAIHIMKQLCVALGAAHEAGIVHRDLKPDNIYLIRRGNDTNFVKVLDFGIAKVGSGTKKLTKAGQVFGTPHYMSPEQCAGTGTDQRTDIYALGVILYEMVCGRVPFDADNLMGVLTKHMYENPIAPHELPPPVNVPPGLEAVILKCLAKSQDVRYQSMGEVLSDLTKIEQGQTPDAVLHAVARSSSPLTGGKMDTGRITMSVGEPALDDDIRPPKSKLPLVMIGGGLAALGVLGLVIAVWGGGGGQEEQVQPTPPPVVEPTPPPETAAPPEPAQPENVAETGSQETARVTLRSEPDSAEVFRGAELLGNTPFSIARPTGEERVELTLRLAGHEEQPVTISALTAENVRITLEEARRGRTGRDRTGPRTTMHNPGMTTATAGMETAPVAEEPVMTPEPPPTMTRPQPQSEVLDPWGN